MAYSKKQIETIFDNICERIEDGEALRTILKEKEMPSSRTFFKWVDSDEEKVKQYARAKQLYADKMFEDILAIADSSTNDIFLDEKGNPAVNHEVIQRDRLRVDTRKWAASKLNPKKYGDKSTLELEGGDKPITINFKD